jgi:plasmid stabilization system protein ParE
MTGTFRPEPEASAEIEDAVLWYEDQRSGLGLEFVQAIDLALEQIAAWPHIGHRVTGVSNDLPARKVPIKRCYSYRNARIGSIRLARCAGIRPAAVDTTTSTATVQPAIAGSCA